MALDRGSGKVSAPNSTLKKLALNILRNSGPNDRFRSNQSLAGTAS